MDSEAVNIDDNENVSLNRGGRRGRPPGSRGRRAAGRSRERTLAVVLSDLEPPRTIKVNVHNDQTALGLLFAKVDKGWPTETPPGKAWAPAK